MASKVDVNDPEVRRLVYNMYRGMLGNYNSKANDYIGTLPKDRVKADEGISKQIESMIRQSSQISGGGSPSPGGTTDGPPVNAAPSFPVPPPPPPPGPSGAIPSVRLITEIADRRGKEPPAAIQNAMMSKDKKPFTYTPGGIDLSQIRSPRMARRIERNAAAEGVTEVPKTQPLPANHVPVAGSAPQMAVPVFPPAPPPPPPMGHTMAMPPPISIPKNPVLRPTGLRYDKPDSENVGVPPPPVQPAHSYVPPPPPQATPTMVQRQPLHEVPVQQNQPATSHFLQRQPPSEPPSPQYQQQQPQPGSIYVPPVTPTRSQTGSLYIAPIGDTPDARDSPRQTPVMSPPPTTPTIASPVKLAKAPTPWLSRPREEPQVPAWAAREEPQVPAWTAREEPTTPTGGTRIIPIQIEGRDPPQQQQQQRQQQQQQQQQQHVVQQQRQQPPPPPPGTRIIPIQMEGGQQQASSPRPRVAQPVYVHNKFNPTSPPPQQESPAYERQQSQGWPAGTAPAPIQSRSFKVLQKITDTDRQEEEQQPEVVQQDYYRGQQQQQPWAPQNTQGVPISQLRKLELSDDDRALMNKFKAQVAQEKEDALNEEENPRYRGGHIPSKVFRMLDQSVDEDSSLHSESDPRYRGAAIPSRAFRILQSMTDTTGEVPQAQVPRGPPAAAQPRVQHVQADQPPQPYIPASEQQVQEPRKYTGGAIPSRSFRMLQAMTAPENCAPGQSDM